MKDFLGREIEQGKKVVYMLSSPNGAYKKGLYTGYVERIHEKVIEVDIGAGAKRRKIAPSRCVVID